MSRRTLTPHAPSLGDANCWSDGVVPMTSAPGGLTANAQGGLSWLLNTLEKEVLPRLLQAHAHSDA